jgi:5-amino-6-(5-phosphoribosylamino)uracil reductase
VTANFVITWDGRISTRNHTPVDFSSKRDKQRLLEIRATADAILAGVRTIASDNMSMGMPDAGLRSARVQRKQAPYPLRVIASNSGRIDPALRIFTKGFSPIVIFSTTRMPQRTRALLAHKADLWLFDASVVKLSSMLTILRAEYRVRRLVCEGGPRLFRALLAERFVDEIYLTLAPRIFGGVRAPTLTGLADEFLPRSIECTLREMEVIEGECFVHYRVN